MCSLILNWIKTNDAKRTSGTRVEMTIALISLTKQNKQSCHGIILYHRGSSYFAMRTNKYLVNYEKLYGKHKSQYHSLYFCKGVTGEYMYSMTRALHLSLK